MERRLGASQDNILLTQGNLAMSYEQLGKHEQALRMRQDVYFGRLKLNGEEDERTVRAANNYALSLLNLHRYTEIKSLLRRSLPMARRVLGEGHRLTLSMRWTYAGAFYEDPVAPLDDLREAVTTLEETERTARRVFGSAHPLTKGIESELPLARAALHARETPSPPGSA